MNSVAMQPWQHIIQPVVKLTSAAGATVSTVGYLKWSWTHNRAQTAHFCPGMPGEYSHGNKDKHYILHHTDTLGRQGGKVKIFGRKEKCGPYNLNRPHLISMVWTTLLWWTECFWLLYKRPHVVEQWHHSEQQGWSTVWCCCIDHWTVFYVVCLFWLFNPVPKLAFCNMPDIKIPDSRTRLFSEIFLVMVVANLWVKATPRGHKLLLLDIKKTFWHATFFQVSEYNTFATENYVCLF